MRVPCVCVCVVCVCVCVCVCGIRHYVWCACVGERGKAAAPLPCIARRRGMGVGGACGCEYVCAYAPVRDGERGYRRVMDALLSSDKGADANMM